MSDLRFCCACPSVACVWQNLCPVLFQAGFQHLVHIFWSWLLAKDLRPTNVILGKLLSGYYHNSRHGFNSLLPNITYNCLNAFLFFFRLVISCKLSTIMFVYCPPLHWWNLILPHKRSQWILSLVLFITLASSVIKTQQQFVDPAACGTFDVLPWVDYFFCRLDGPILDPKYMNNK